MKRTKVKQIVNNVIYVEPNYTYSTEEYDSNGLNTYEFTPPLEDYSIYINLEVEIRGRNVQSTTTTGGKTLVMSYVSTADGKSTVNFMQGTKIPIGENGAYINSLTTNYTDLFIRDIKSNGPSTEMFGIRSIDISYNNYMVPEVTIEFVDVRGVALFAQKEAYETNKNIDAAINSNNQADIANTFFQCFFTFPYPKFKLLVKGFYGQPVSYELTCADFRARFDSSTGNFACTAKFVGYHFSFLNDVMMNGLVAAPYSDYEGSKYWDNRDFKIDGLNDEKVNCPKLGWLLGKMKEIETDVETIKQSDPTAQEKIDLDNKKTGFIEVENAYREFTDKIKAYSNTKNYGEITTFFEEKSNNGLLKCAVILSPSNDTVEERNNRAQYRDYVNDESGEIESKYNTLVDTINDFNKNNSNETLPIPLNFHESYPIRRVYNFSNNENGATVAVSNTDIQERYPVLYKIFKNGVEQYNKTHVVNPLLSFRNGYFYYDNGFSDMLEAYKKSNGEKTVDVEKRIEQLHDTAISKVLGFRPTVINLTKIVMAHFETFAYMIFKTAKNICDESASRTLSELNINDNLALSDVSDKNNFVPPFPRIVKESNKNGSRIREESWVGDYSGKFREKDLVNGLINGVKEVSLLLKNFNGNEEGASGEAGSEGRKVSIVKYPLSPIDIVASEKPYDTHGFDSNSIPSVLGLVGLRAVGMLGTCNFKNWGKNPKALGIAEAYNFLDNNTLSNEMIDKLSIVANSLDDVISMMKGIETGSIKKPSNGVWPWRIDSSDNEGILSQGTDDAYLSICRTKLGGWSIPYQNLSWDKVISDTVSSENGFKAAISEEYIDSNDNIKIKSNTFTFDTNINRFSSIVENQLKDVEGIGDYQQMFLEECKYNPSKYNQVLFSEAKEIIAYKIDNAASIVPSDGSCMLPTSKAAFSDKSIEGGYEMEHFHEQNLGGNWKDKDNNNVMRKGASGFTDYLNNFNSRDFTFTEFPGLMPNLSFHIGGTSPKGPATSVFSQMLYYKQEDIRSKALLFLASLGYVFNYKAIINNYICSDNVTICILPLPSIMFVGALLWSTTNKEKLKKYNTGYYEDCIESLSKLRNNIKRRFISIFEKWVNEGVEGDSLLHSFASFKDGLELGFSSETDSDKFFTNLGEQEEEGIFGNKKTDWLKRFGNGSYTSLMDFYKGELPDNFFENYITVDEDVYGSTSDFTRGLRLGVRDGGNCSLFACNFALAGCVFSKNSKFFNSKTETDAVKVNIGELKLFFNGFLEGIKGSRKEPLTVNDGVSQAKEPDDSNTDIKIGIYRYCKMLYDKWIAGLSEETFNELWTVDEFFEKDSKYFHFIDAYYNKAESIPLNIGDFCEQIVSCFKSDQYSLLSFLSSVYSKNKLNFLCVQNFLDLGKRNNIEKMFDAVPYTDTWEIKKHPNFIVMYPYETSNHLADMENSEYENDGFMINLPDNNINNKWPEPLKSFNSNGFLKYNIPAFGVSYGKLYQSYFQSVDVSMDSPTVTEQSIKAQFQIASQHNEDEQTGDRSKIYTYGQDLYSIYSNNSYTCNVTMMGCAWVQPLMYFVLNNVPMFRGTYLIEKVTHHIEPGVMTTKFMGVRMANVCTRIAEEDALRSRLNQTGEESSAEDITNLEGMIADIDNDCPYKVFPLTFDGGDITLSDNLDTNASQIMRLIMSRGYSKEQAAGIVGNMQVESPGLNPKTVVCDSLGWYSGGLCMWHKNSLEALINKDPKNAFNEEYNGYKCVDNNRKKEIIAQMPSASYQVNFLLDTLETSRNIKKYILAEKTVKGAAFVFAKRYEICKGCKKIDSETVKLRIKNAERFYNNYRETQAPPIAKNDGKQVSDLANGFLDAINKTSKSSAVNVEVGVIKENSKGDTIWLNNPHKDSKFGKVFDIILSGYGDKVEKVNWVLPGNGENINDVPIAYLVTVKDGSNTISINVTTEGKPNTPLSNKIPISTGNEQSGIHDDFCKSLVKKYKTNNETLRKDTHDAINDYNVLFTTMIKTTNNEEHLRYVPKSCDATKAEHGLVSNNNGSGSSENEYGFIGNWDVGKFVQRLHYWQNNICKAKGKQRKKPGGGCSSCTGVINRALKDTGFGEKYWGQYPWEVYSKFKLGDDFVEISSGLNVTNKTEFSLGNINRGDICVMWGMGKVYPYHTCAYDGNNWYSDFKQNSCNVYKSSSECRMEWHLFRHK